MIELTYYAAKDVKLSFSVFFIFKQAAGDVGNGLNGPDGQGWTTKTFSGFVRFRPVLLGLTVTVRITRLPWKPVAIGLARFSSVWETMDGAARNDFSTHH